MRECSGERDVVLHLPYLEMSDSVFYVVLRIFLIMQVEYSP